MAKTTAPVPFSPTRLFARKPGSADTRPPTPPGAGGPAPAKHGHGRLFFQLGYIFSALALLPLLLVGILNYRYVAADIVQEREEHLQALVTRQADDISGYFERMNDVARLMAASPAVREIFTGLGSVTPAEYGAYASRPEYRAAGQMWAARFGDFFSDLKLDQIYLVNPQGLVIFSAGRAGGVLYNLREPPASSLALAGVYRKVMETRALATSPLTTQTPTGEPALYLAAPVATDNGVNLAGALILSLDYAALRKILNNNIGLGDTGESLVLTRLNDKFIALNQPRFNSGALLKELTPLTGQPLFGEGRTSAGESLVAQATDYRGTDVLAAWTYLPVLGWTIVQKVDRAEVFERLIQLRNLNLYVGGGTLLLVLLAAGWLTRGITQPVVRLTAVAERIAQGDLSENASVRAKNEIGILAQAVNTMARSLKSLVRRVQDSAAVISTNATQMAATARQQSEISQAAGASTVEVAAAAKQISATSQELTHTMEVVNNVAQDTAQQAETGLDGLAAIQTTMGELEQARAAVAAQLELIAQKAQAIACITVTMTKIADQTNLLSLNAAIEARKAGDYGRGFNVVAREIQRLADQVGVATLEIERTITEMLKSVKSGVDSMAGFSAKAGAGLDRVQTVSRELTSVIQQVQGLPPRFEMVLQGMQSQSEGAKQITEAISQMCGSTQQTATAIHEALLLLEQLRDTSRSLQGEVSLFKCS